MPTDRTEAPQHLTDLIAGADPNRPLDAIFVNPPLRDYTQRPRVNDYTLPVLGMAYIATYAQRCGGFNVGVLDAEAHGLGIEHTARLINAAAPRWAGFNLLAPTYQISARIAHALDPSILVMVGGHHAKAMPQTVLTDPRFERLTALILGEGETRVAALLEDHTRRAALPQVMWRDRLLGTTSVGIHHGDPSGWVSPDINALPFVDRAFLPQDPYTAEDGRLEGNIVGSRGCPYDCGFCGAAVSQNRELTIRTRTPDNILSELDEMNARYGTTAYRFVDDLFLGAERIIRTSMTAFTADRTGERYVWDATGRINVLHRLDDTMLDTLAANGLREVALGIESGSDRVLTAMDKRITSAMTTSVTRRLLERGIGVKGYFILGYPGELTDDLTATVEQIHRLWDLADTLPGSFRASVFEFRPYPGSPVWEQLIQAGHDPQQMQAYGDVDLTEQGADEAMRGRDEFNFSVGIAFSQTPLPLIRQHLADLSRQQHSRNGTGLR